MAAYYMAWQSRLIMKGFRWHTIFAKKSLSVPMILDDMLVLAQLIRVSFPNFSTCTFFKSILKTERQPLCGELRWLHTWIKIYKHLRLVTPIEIQQNFSRKAMANKFQETSRKTAMDVIENNVTFVASFSSIYLHASRMASCSHK